MSITETGSKQPIPKPPDVVCAFCGQGSACYDDPDFSKKAADHIMSCEKHPLRAYVVLNAEMLEALRAAEKELVGVYDELLPRVRKLGVSFPGETATNKAVLLVRAAIAKAGGGA